MKSRSLFTFALGVATSFAVLAGANSIAQQGEKMPMPGITFSAGQCGIYDAGSYIYVVKPGGSEFHIIEKGASISRGEDGAMIPVGWHVKGAHCEVLTSRTWSK